ncbi:MAG: sulfur carrier protein ThiS [Bacillota bacterium]
MFVNGKEMELPAAITIAQLLEKLSLRQDTVVVEVNLQIVSKDEYGVWLLQGDDKVEIVSFVGGG